MRSRRSALARPLCRSCRGERGTGESEGEKGHVHDSALRLDEEMVAGRRWCGLLRLSLWNFVAEGGGRMGGGGGSYERSIGLEGSGVLDLAVLY